MQVWMVRHKKTKEWLAKEYPLPAKRTDRLRFAKVYRHPSPAKAAVTRCGDGFEVVCFTLVETVEVADA